jgi:hypothetical protein
MITLGVFCGYVKNEFSKKGNVISNELSDKYGVIAAILIGTILKTSLLRAHIVQEMRRTRL